MKGLADNYHVYFIDIIGMGGSSRPVFTLKEATETDEYFIKFIEQWRIAIGNIT